MTAPLPSSTWKASFDPPVQFIVSDVAIRLVTVRAPDKAVVKSVAEIVAFVPDSVITNVYAVPAVSPFAVLVGSVAIGLVKVASDLRYTAVLGAPLPFMVGSTENVAVTDVVFTERVGVMPNVATDVI